MKKYIVLIFASLLVSYVSAQSISSYVVASAGETSEGGGISLSWTLGEVAIETLSANDNSIVLTQGFQQGYFEITSIGDPFSNNFSLNVYPNPATEFVLIDLKSDEIKDAVVEMYDLEGKLVYTNKFNVIEGQNRIDLSGMSSSQYILRVNDSAGNVLQTFKLIKR